MSRRGKHLVVAPVPREFADHPNPDYNYRVIIGASRRMSEVTDESAHLTVTSPAYPMVSIWDDSFAEAQAPSYQALHAYLNEAWRELRRLLVPGRIAGVN